MRSILLLAALLAAAPAAAQRAPEWRTAPEEDVLLRPFAYEPSISPSRRAAVNRASSTGGATLASAPGFFAAAQILPAIGGRARGQPPPRPGERITIALVPARAATARGAATSATVSSG